MEKELELLRNLHETAMEERDYWIENTRRLWKRGCARSLRGSMTRRQ